MSVYRKNEKPKYKIPWSKMTPYQKLVDAAERGVSIRLSVDEVEYLVMFDDAIQQAASIHDYDYDCQIKGIPPNNLCE